MNSPHDGADVPGQVPAAGGGGEVLLGVQPVRVDHEVAVGQVSVGGLRRSTERSAPQETAAATRLCVCVWSQSSHLRSFGLVLPVEELGQSSSLDLVDANRGKTEKSKVSQISGFNGEKFKSIFLKVFCFVTDDVTTLKQLLGTVGAVRASSPVVVEPGAVAGDDDVVSLFRHVVLAGIHQTIDFGFALFLVVLRRETERRVSGALTPPGGSRVKLWEILQEFVKIRVSV